MVDIQLNPQYKLLSDTHQWIIAKKEGEEYRHVAFFEHLPHACHEFLQRSMRQSAATNIPELLEALKVAKAQLSAALQPLQFRVEVQTIPKTKKEGVPDA